MQQPAAGWRPEERFLSFLSALDRADLPSEEQLQAGNCFLSLEQPPEYTQSPSLLGRDQLGTRLFIRKCHMPLVHKVMQKRHSVKQGEDLAQRAVIVTGNAGMGKVCTALVQPRFSCCSLFAPTELCVRRTCCVLTQTVTMVTLLIKSFRQLQPAPTIVLELLDSESRGFVLPPPGTIAPYAINPGQRIDVMNDPSTVYICDVSAGAKTLRHLGAAFRVVIVSPHSMQQSLFRGWVKNSRLASVLYMPCWTEDELEACRRICFRTKREEKENPLPGKPWTYSVTATALHERFERFGGSVRCVLSDTTDAEEHSRMLEQAINSCDIKHVPEQATQSMEWLPPASSYLFHYDVRQEGEADSEEEEEEGEDEEVQEKAPKDEVEEKRKRRRKGKAGAFTIRAINIASQHIAHELVIKKGELHQSEVLDFIDVTCSNSIWSGSSGMLFERMVAHVLLHGGGLDHSGQYQVQQFKEPDEDGKWPYGKPRKAAAFLHSIPASSSALSGVNRDLAGLDGAVSGQYFQPTVGHFPTIDSLILPDQLFQITVGAQHDIDLRGLCSAVTALRDLLPPTADDEQPVPINFFFVVPFVQFAIFKPGAFAFKPEKTKKKQKEDDAQLESDPKSGAEEEEEASEPRPKLPRNVNYFVLSAYGGRYKEPGSSNGNGKRRLSDTCSPSGPAKRPHTKTRSA